DGHLVSLDATTGETGWSLRLGGPFVSPPAVNGSLIVIGSPSGLVWCVDSGTGEVRGRFRHEEPVLVTPAVVDGLWIVPGERGLMVACRWGDDLPGTTPEDSGASAADSSGADSSAADSSGGAP
ncbi:MAG: serine/threonine protein kinase, partial [bacterium]